MKQILRLIAATGLLAAFVWSAPAARAATPAKVGEVPSAGLELAKTATQVTGIAISPLLGVTAVGAYQWFTANTPAQKARLPWFAHPLFWIPCSLLVLACALKDTCGAVIPPGLKKPFDAMELVENKISGLVAAGAVVPVLINSASKFMVHGTPAASFHVHLGGLAMLAPAAFDSSWLLNILMVPLSLAVFGIVWIASHAINVLILLSPWGAVDAGLKAARTALLGLVTATAWIDPVVGVSLSLVIVIIAYFIAGWSFRLTVFGWLFCWDFFTGRRRRFNLLAEGNAVFTGREFNGVPVRTYGRLYLAADGAMTLKFRPWLVLSERQAAVPQDGLVVGRGVFYSEVLGHDVKADRNRTLLLLPPRYLGHEELFARTYHISGTCEVGLRRAWSWLKETVGVGGRASPAT